MISDLDEKKNSDLSQKNSDIGEKISDISEMYNMYSVGIGEAMLDKKMLAMRRSRKRKTDHVHGACARVVRAERKMEPFARLRFELKTDMRGWQSSEMQIKKNPMMRNLLKKGLVDQ